MVTKGEEVRQQMGTEVAVVGQLERVPMSKGRGEWHGTGLVLDDGTTVYVTYGAPPEGWAKLVGVRVRVKGVLSPSIDDHSQSLMAPHLRAAQPPEKAPRTLASLVGQRARLSGVARDAKGGAVLVVDGAPLYLEGLDSWPAGVGGKAVVAGGTVVEKQHLPEAKRDARGAISQGAVGKQLVLEAPQWALAEPPPKVPAPKQPGPTK